VTARTIIETGVNPTLLNDLVNVKTDLTYGCIGKLDTNRATFTLKEWNLELDKNQYLGVVDYELECECGSDAKLEKLKEYLTKTYGIKCNPSSPKSGRYLQKYFQSK
ncbi:MAG: CYTH domain-containing protein, partial [Clostridia bacterium]|nr:CYTH domain-containing protein [Clostridia bacterium]